MTGFSPEQTLKVLTAGGKAALARSLGRIEASPDAADVTALLDAAWAMPRGHVVGITGPPGVGKSSLTKTMIAAWRARARTVAVIAVDPSSRRSGGALLGDRVRLATDPEDRGLFVRSMAARDRLGGLADLTFPAMTLMRALYDIVVIETVGVGQSETDVTGAADTVVCCIQPGSGDSLQFIKAGIMEVPHIAVVTKADMDPLARRAQADVRGALTLFTLQDEGWTVPVLRVSAMTGDGVADLVQAIDDHARHLRAEGRLDQVRAGQGDAWLRAAIIARFGAEGAAAADRLNVPADSPFARLRWVRGRLAIRVRNSTQEQDDQKHHTDST